MDHLYYVKPMKSKNSRAVKLAIQEIVLQLRQGNLPVTRIHTKKLEILNHSTNPKSQLLT